MVLITPPRLASLYPLAFHNAIDDLIVVAVLYSAVVLECSSFTVTACPVLPVNRVRK